MRSAGRATVRKVGLTLALMWLATASDAVAQSNFMPRVSAASENSPGLIVTPTLVYSGAWDDNILLQGRGDQTRSDYLSIVNPQAHVTYNGRRGRIDGAYDGAFLLYRGLNALNNYNQRGALSARRLLTKHLSLFTNGNFASVPTTELVDLVAVPFVQTGSKLADLRAGVDAALGRRTLLVASYNFDWVRFDSRPEFVSVLHGGHLHGGSANLRHQISSGTTLTADYALQHAILAGNAQVFDIQNATAGVEERLSQQLRVFGAAGVARLNVNAGALTRTGPAYRAGLIGEIRRATVGVSYSHSLVPAFSFGGTTENEEVTAYAHLPLARKLAAQSSLAWRKNDPILIGDLSLRSWWIEAEIGYALQPWVRIEAFYGGTHQTINRPGGMLDRNRIGFQIVTTKPMRVY